jgi:hypothetical protein
MTSITESPVKDTIIIGFGYKAEQGKDVCVQHIIDSFPQYDIQRFAFADPLKLEFYNALQYPLDPYWQSARDYFHLPHPRNDFASVPERLAWINEHKPQLAAHLQRYGTEYRRVQDSLYWVNQTRNNIERAKPQFALISDVRFPNEFLYVRSFGGITVKVTRLGYVSPTRNPNHPSEIALDGMKFHYQIDVPDGKPEELKTDAIAVFNMILESLKMQEPGLEAICVSNTSA